MELDSKYKASPDGKLCTDWEKRFLKMVDARQPFERQWYLNIAFYFSRQYAAWVGSEAAGKFTLQDLPARRRWHVRVVANKIQPIVRNELTKLNKEEPQFYCVPSTSENEDIAAARAAELIAEYTLDTGGYRKARRVATLWTLLCGSGYLHPHLTGNKSEVFGKLTPDKLKIKAPTTFNIYVPNLAVENIEDQKYVIHSYLSDPEELYAMYGIEVPTEEIPKGADYENRILSMMGIKDNNNSTKGALVKEVYVKPNYMFPNGCAFITAGGKLLYMNEKLDESVENVTDDLGSYEKISYSRPKEKTEEEIEYLDANHSTQGKDGYKEHEYPYKHGMYPFIKIDHIPAARYYGLSVIEGIIPLQKEYNRARSQIRQSSNLTAQSQWTYQIGSIENPQKLTNEPGIAIPYRAGFQPPTPVKNPDFPVYAIQDQDRILKDIDDFSGQYEISHGRTPPGVEAASAIAYLKEENDTRIYHTSASIEEATQDLGVQILSLIQEFWSREKIIKVTSRNNKDDVEAFKVADMKNNTDFRVEPGSMAPRSRAARQALILELMKSGFIKPEEGLQYLQLIETNRLWDDMQIDSRQVQRENMMFKKGVDLPINSYDNNELHVLYHQKWMKTQDYELLDPQIKEQIEHHVRTHKMEIARLQQAMQPPQPNEGDQLNAGVGPEPATA